MWAVASYVMKQKLSGRRRFPLVLQLEPLFQCNLNCAGCGKIQYPVHVLKRRLSPEQCFEAVEACGVPIVAIPGGEPMLHPEIEAIVNGLIERGKYIYVCTNATMLRQRLEEGWFTPHKQLSFSVHLDGLQAQHDFAVCREGTFEKATDAIRFAIGRGYRVTTNTTLFEGANPALVRDFFDYLMDLGVEGMMLSAGYAYSAAPDQSGFLQRQKTQQLFRAVLSNRKKRWVFNQSPLFLEFLMGLRDYECTPWGIPTYSIFGWQKPCYLLDEGHAETFDELMTETEWDAYGLASGNPKCRDCMVHCGYEPTSVMHTFGPGMPATIMAMLRRYPDPEMEQQIEQARAAASGAASD